MILRKELVIVTTIIIEEMLKRIISSKVKKNYSRRHTFKLKSLVTISRRLSQLVTNNKFIIDEPLTSPAH